MAAGLGAIFGALLTRWTEKYKQLQSLRAAAYVDFLRGVSKLGVVQKDTLRDKDSFLEEREATIIVADAKARIAIYGSKEVVQSLSTFMDGGAVLDTGERLRSFAEMCQLMRNESSPRTQRVSFDVYTSCSSSKRKSPAVCTALHVLRSSKVPSVALHLVECTF